MPLTLVERSFPEKRTLEELRGLETAAAPHLDENGVSFALAYVSRDGRRLLSLYQAPSFDAVARALEQSGFAFDSAWPVMLLSEAAQLATTKDIGDRVIVICERKFPEAADIETISGMQSASRWCLDENDITQLESYIRPEGVGTICAYAAPDAESVRRASRTVGIPFDSAWTATVIEGSPAV